MIRATELLLSGAFLLPGVFLIENTALAEGRDVQASAAETAANTGSQKMHALGEKARDRAKQAREDKKQKEEDKDEAGAQAKEDEAKRWDKVADYLAEQEKAFQQAATAAKLANSALATSPSDADKLPFFQKTAAKLANNTFDSQVGQALGQALDPIASKVDPAVNSAIDSVTAKASDALGNFADKVASADVGPLNGVKDVVAGQLADLSQLPDLSALDNPVGQLKSSLSNAIATAPTSVRQSIGSLGAAGQSLYNSQSSIFAKWFPSK